MAEVSGRDLIDRAVVLGVVVEELVVRDDFRDREHMLSGSGLVATARELGARHEGLDHHLIALAHSQGDGGSQLLERLHLCHAETRTAGIRLDETRQTDVVDDLVVRDEVFVALAHDKTFRDADAEALQVLVQRELVESH